MPAAIKEQDSVTPTPTRGPIEAAGAVVCAVSVDRDPPPWAEYLSARADTLFHDPAWGAVLVAAYGHRPYYLTAQRGGPKDAARQDIYPLALKDIITSMMPGPL